MSFWQQIVAFALRGLKPSYYWRHFVLGAIVPVIIIGLQIYACFSNSEISTGTAVIGILSYIAGALFLLILYPFSRFAYESIVEFVMGNNVITQSIFWRFTNLLPPISAFHTHICISCYIQK